MLLKTERLTIRHIVEDDWINIRDLWKDFNASEFSQYDVPHNTEDEDVRVRISKWARANSGMEHMFFAEIRSSYMWLLIFEKMDTRLAIASIQNIMVKDTQKKVSRHSLNMFVRWELPKLLRAQQ